MPKGTRQTEAGTLRSNQFGFVLEMDGVEFWALEMWSVRKPQRYLGERVSVEGREWVQHSRGQSDVVGG